MGYAPRDHRPPRSRRARCCASCTAAVPPCAATRPRCCAGGASHAGSATPASGRRMSPRRPSPGSIRSTSVLGMQARGHGAEAECGAAVRRDPVPRDHAAGLRAVPHRRPAARARGGRGQARRRRARHRPAHDLRASATRHDNDWRWLCDLTVVAMEGVTPRGPGLLLRRRPSGGGARVALPDGYVPLTLESAELDELYDVRIAAGCDEVAGPLGADARDDRVAVRACARGARGRDGRRQRAARDGGAARLGRRARRVRADACWLAHAFVDDVRLPRRRPPPSSPRGSASPCGRS